ncbi:hypothetical protein GBAR_LOCUS9435 [Geodia barretti]|uniref:Uncharacterized protein n=1 Tax=Geodia barretti TaxID=519541 RepID=A0AA35RPZ7_GEOBA|nr:hypothetical protein GBAR_LOCUS9435 [Geodia barretti]
MVRGTVLPPPALLVGRVVVARDTPETEEGNIRPLAAVGVARQCRGEGRMRGKRTEEGKAGQEGIGEGDTLTGTVGTRKLPSGIRAAAKRLSARSRLVSTGLPRQRTQTTGLRD